MEKTTSASKDVEMKDTEKTEKTEETKDPDLLTLEDIRDQVRNIDKAAHTKERRFAARSLRALPSLRRRVNPSVLRQAVSTFCQSFSKESILGFIPESNVVSEKFDKVSTPQNLAFECEIYIEMLICMYLLDEFNKKKIEKTPLLNCGKDLLNKITSHSVLDSLSARAFFYCARSMEVCKEPEEPLRPILHAALRTSTLRGHVETEATLLVLLLRSYVEAKLYTQADKLVSKTTMPENASSNQHARYLYYVAKLRAIQLDYSSAYKHLVAASRKAPSSGALGFRQHVARLTVVVQLLLGDIPERGTFRASGMRHTLEPYLELTRAVRAGRLDAFGECLTKHEKLFEEHATYTLIVRIRHNVIKAGVRRIASAYSRISLVDVATKLGLDSPEDAEYIVSKAIRDKVLDPTSTSVDHESGNLDARHPSDVYITMEPTYAFDTRLSYCLKLQRQCVKALRYPPKSYQRNLETPEQRREREQHEIDAAADMPDDDFDGF